MAIRRSATATPNVEDYLAEEDEVFETEAPAAPAVSPDLARPTEAEVALEAEDEDESADRSSSVQAGWASAHKAISRAGSGFVVDFRFTDEVQLIKFMSGDPIAVYRQHWLKERQVGRKSYVCVGERCPLCRTLGHSPDQKIAFSVLNLSADEPEVQLLAVGPRLAGQLEKLHLAPRTGPLDDASRLWAVSRSGKGTSTSYSLMPVKMRDVPEEWQLDPDDVAKAVAAAKPLDSSVIRTESRETLMDLARELLG